MAKTKLRLTCCVCGCEFVHEHFSYNRRLADEYEEWAKGNINTCPKCYHKEIKISEENRENDLISEYLEKFGVTLVDLEGTERQIVWANEIRRKFFAHVIQRGLISDSTERSEFMEKINEKVSAKWWIDNRFRI